MRLRARGSVSAHVVVTSHRTMMRPNVDVALWLWNRCGIVDVHHRRHHLVLHRKEKNKLLLRRIKKGIFLRIFVVFVNTQRIAIRFRVIVKYGSQLPPCEGKRQQVENTTLYRELGCVNVCDVDAHNVNRYNVVDVFGVHAFIAQ
eukprot:PhF_6_TR31392/c1_g1_i3/m.45984